MTFHAPSDQRHLRAGQMECKQIRPLLPSLGKRINPACQQLWSCKKLVYFIRDYSILLNTFMLIIIIIIIALTDAIRDFFLQSPHCAANCLQHARAHACANHVQHIERLSRATCRMPRGTKGQLSYSVWQIVNRIHFRLLYWLNH